VVEQHHEEAEERLVLREVAVPVAVDRDRRVTRDKRARGERLQGVQRLVGEGHLLVSQRVHRDQRTGQHPRRVVGLDRRDGGAIGGGGAGGQGEQDVVVGA